MFSTLSGLFFPLCRNPTRPYSRAARVFAEQCCSPDPVDLRRILRMLWILGISGRFCGIMGIPESRLDPMDLRQTLDLLRILRILTIPRSRADPVGSWRSRDLGRILWGSRADPVDLGQILWDPGDPGISGRSCGSPADPADVTSRTLVAI